MVTIAKSIGTLLYVSILLAPVLSTAIAQRSVTLDECLRIAHSQAPALIQAKRSYEIARDNAEAASRSLRSQVDLTLAAPIYSDNTTPIYNPSSGLTDLLSARVTEFGPGLTIRQPVYWTGGTLSLNTSLYRRTQLTAAGESIQDYLGVGSITLDQPIFKTNEMKLSERESEMNLELARAEYLTAWATINYTIKSLFYNLYQNQQQLAIQEEQVAASAANYQLASNKFKAGLIAEVDALELEVDLASARTDLFDRERQLLAAERALQAALGQSLTSPITASLDSLSGDEMVVEPGEAVHRALEARADILSSRFDIERSENAMARTGNTRAINASLTGSFGASQDATSLSLISQNPYVNRGLTLLISVPIFDWGVHSLRMDAAEAGIEISRTALAIKQQEVEAEVRSTIEQLESARKQVEVAKKSVAVAEKAYGLSRSRFDAGKITSQDLTLGQQRLTKARLSSLTAEVAVHLALADLTQKTLFDYEAGRPLKPE